MGKATLQPGFHWSKTDKPIYQLQESFREQHWFSPFPSKKATPPPFPEVRGASQDQAAAGPALCEFAEDVPSSGRGSPVQVGWLGEQSPHSFSRLGMLHRTRPAQPYRDCCPSIDDLSGSPVDFLSDSRCLGLAPRMARGAPRHPRAPRQHQERYREGGGGGCSFSAGGFTSTCHSCIIGAAHQAPTSPTTSVTPRRPLLHGLLHPLNTQHLPTTLAAPLLASHQHPLWEASLSPCAAGRSGSHTGRWGWGMVLSSFWLCFEWKLLETHCQPRGCCLERGSGQKMLGGFPDLAPGCSCLAFTASPGRETSWCRRAFKSNSRAGRHWHSMRGASPARASWVATGSCPGAGDIGGKGLLAIASVQPLFPTGRLGWSLSSGFSISQPCPPHVHLHPHPWAQCPPHSVCTVDTAHACTGAQTPLKQRRFPGESRPPPPTCTRPCFVPVFVRTQNSLFLLEALKRAGVAVRAPGWQHQGCLELAMSHTW